MMLSGLLVGVIIYAGVVVALVSMAFRRGWKGWGGYE